MQLKALCLMILFLTLTAFSFPGESRIVGGNLATEKKRVAIGSLYNNRQAPANEGHFCAATLIRPRWALTAAHCLEYIRRRNTDIVFGRDDLRFSGGLRRAVVRKYSYPKYNKKNSAWDLALIYLNSPVRIKPLALQTRDPLPGQRLAILGWGQTGPAQDTSTQLQEARVFAKSKKKCRKIYDYIDPQEAFCAGSKKGDDVCFGDSGGPALNSRGQIAGVISRGGRCGNPKYPGVYSRIAFARRWIRDTLDKRLKPPFRSPRKEKRYNALLSAPYSEIGEVNQEGWRWFGFSVDSRERISSVSLEFKRGASFCSHTGECDREVWFLEDLDDSYHEAWALSGMSQDRCLRFTWRVRFVEQRLPARQGIRRVCAAKEKG